ncbi:hypothetical protein [Chitinilyticum aquatile]|uniref:hypothetical protein n=1 Tax=Chitinilyticum aquatile TaxID=362520 RepID=UPI00048F1DB9|nr:hypothetical protein [Chitinilyticum aquatile]
MKTLFLVLALLSAPAFAGKLEQTITLANFEAQTITTSCDKIIYTPAMDKCSSHTCFNAESSQAIAPMKKRAKKLGLTNQQIDSEMKRAYQYLKSIDVLRSEGDAGIDGIGIVEQAYCLALEDKAGKPLF